MVLATTYFTVEPTDSALIYAKGEHYGIQGNIIKYLANIWYSMGGIYIKKGLDSLALSYYKRSLDYAIAEGNLTVVGGICKSFRLLSVENKADSALRLCHQNHFSSKVAGCRYHFCFHRDQFG